MALVFCNEKLHLLGVGQLITISCYAVTSGMQVKIWIGKTYPLLKKYQALVNIKMSGSNSAYARENDLMTYFQNEHVYIEFRQNNNW